MNQPMERQQDGMKERKCGQWSTQKKRAVLAVVIALLALLAVPVLAWLYMQRSIETITKINMLILSILVDTFISKISLTMQPGPKIDSISGA